MCRSISKCRLLLLLVLVIDLFYQVVSEYCGNDKYCQTPYKCCASKQACCYDHDYTRGFKLHVWNMWYFWLVIIFVLMSCFGGCGYYRRRRLAALQQQSFSSPQSPRRVCTGRPAQRRHTSQPGFYVYTGPGLDTASDLHLPPPYIEVIQQPNLYPASKVELPPYPGPPADKDPHHRMEEGIEEVSPPPYYEIAQNATSSMGRDSRYVAVEQVSTPAEAEHGRAAGSNQAPTSS